MQQIQEISTKRKDVQKLKAYYVFFTGKLSIGQKEKTKENGIIPNQMLCNLSDILLNKAFCLGTIVTCSFAVERIKFFPKMNKLQETSAIHIIFTVTDLKIVQSQKFVDWKNDHDSKNLMILRSTILRILSVFVSSILPGLPIFVLLEPDVQGLCSAAPWVIICLSLICEYGSKSLKFKPYKKE